MTEDGSTHKAIGVDLETFAQIPFGATSTATLVQVSHYDS
jgi:hypothetical protein